ncbi:MAG: SRPBCC family protein [Candidatus Nitrosopolaris sp.]
MVETFVRSTLIAKAPSNEVFSWHIREGAFERLNPPWQRFTVIQRKGSIQSNGLVEIRSKIGLLSFKWVVKHSDYIDGTQFRDTQVSGAFSSWIHTHLFTSIGSSFAY